MNTETAKAKLTLLAPWDHKTIFGWSKISNASRWPIDLRDDRSAAARCLEEELAEPGQAVAPLTPFETGYCADPRLADTIKRMREARAGG
uniref:NUDIX hydrolase n=1 Tax=Globodera pallida TaxID=36090 RepID=A0A183C8A7_GLOPA